MNDILPQRSMVVKLPLPSDRRQGITDSVFCVMLAGHRAQSRDGACAGANPPVLPHGLRS